MAGQLTHFEIRAGDAARAKRFWGSLFGWTIKDWEGPVPYSLIDTGTAPGGGLYGSAQSERGVVVYFDADDVDAATARVKELGGKVLEPKSPIPGIGWFARCEDTEGNPFSLFQSDESVSVPG